MIETTDVQARYFAWVLTRRCRGGDLDRIGQALFDAAVGLNLHQIEAALTKALEENNTYFQVEREKLDQWAEMQLLAAEQSLHDTTVA